MHILHPSDPQDGSLWGPSPWVSLGVGAGGGWPRAGWVTPLVELLSGLILVRATGHKASLCQIVPRQHPGPARSHPAAAPTSGSGSSGCAASLGMVRGTGPLDRGGTWESWMGMGNRTLSQGRDTGSPARDGMWECPLGMGHRSPPARDGMWESQPLASGSFSCCAGIPWGGEGDKTPGQGWDMGPPAGDGAQDPQPGTFPPHQ